MKAGRLKEKLGKQDFHYDLKEVLEPVTAKEAEAIEKQIQPLQKYSQSTTRAIGQQTQGFVRAFEYQTKKYSLAVQQFSQKLN